MQANRQEQVMNINFKVLSRQKTLGKLQRIIQTIQFGVLAKYNIEAKFWSYLKYKGPLFLVEDSYKQLKLAILNQSMSQNYVFKLEDQTNVELKKLNQNGYMLNYTCNDSIAGIDIYGIWTMDPKIENLYQYLIKKSS